MNEIKFWKVKDLLELVSIGQLIEIIFLNNDFDETGAFLFENDKHDPNYKFYENNYSEKNIDFVSTEGEYLRIEVRI